jgi:hypothetical protein
VSKGSQAYAAWRNISPGIRTGGRGELHIASSEDAAAVALAAHDGYAVQIAIGSPGGRAMTPAELAESLLTPLQTAVGVEGRRRAAL